MSDEQTYDEGRAENLVRLLRALAERISQLDQMGTLLQHTPDLMRLVGDVKSELFHYEVRATYDTPEIAEHRRIVQEARQTDDNEWQKTEWSPDDPEASE